MITFTFYTMKVNMSGAAGDKGGDRGAGLVPHNRHNYFKSDSRKGICVALEWPKTEMVEKHPRNLFMCWTKEAI